MKHLLTVAASVCLWSSALAGVSALSSNSANSTTPTWNGLPVDWRLPLNLGVTDAAPTLLFATDGSTIYTTDNRGTIFAVNSADGSLRWSNAGSSMLQEFVLFKERPSVLYGIINKDWFVDGAFKQVSKEVFALSTVDGSELGRLKNVTGAWNQEAGNYIKRTEQGIVTVSTLDGLLATDASLNPLWNHNVPVNNNFPEYTHITASKDIIIGLYKDNFEKTRNVLRSFDATTGKLICELDKMSAGWNQYLGLPLAIGWESNIVVAARSHYVGTHGAWSEYIGNWTQVDGRTCKHFYRGVIQNDRFFSPYQAAALIGDTLLDANLTHHNRSTGHYIVQSYTLGAEAINWNVSLPQRGLINPLPPIFSNAAFQPDVVIVWNSGVFIALNKTDGATVWEYTNDRVPISYEFYPASQVVYPLGTGELFVPNLQGFVTLNVKTGTLGTVVKNSPISATASAISQNDGQPIAVVADPISGDLIALKSGH